MVREAIARALRALGPPLLVEIERAVRRRDGRAPATHRRRRRPIARRLRRDSSSAVLPRWLFGKALAAVYLLAFSSLRGQVVGLLGRRGLLPVEERLRRRRALEPAPWPRLRRAPTLFWLDASDEALVRACRAGELSSLLALAGVLPRAALAAAWALYLSLVTVSGDFLSFQWDALLLEAGALGALAAPSGIRPGLAIDRPPTVVERLALRLLFVRLHFESGLAKVQSGDPTWRDLSALAAYYETAPLPTPLGWWAHHLPPPLHRAATGAALAIELAAPLALGPRAIRRATLAATELLQVAIAATGNYGFFNLLSAAIGLAVVDDADLGASPRFHPRRRGLRARIDGVARSLAALVPLSVAGAYAWRRLARRPLPRRLARVERLAAELAPLRLASSYGLFAMMTTERPEISVEGSRDGVRWRPYVFRHKPGDPARGPSWAQPHMPRLDWLLWFAALGGPPPWFEMLLARLLEGEPSVLALLDEDPFAGAPPRFVRARLYDYRMTTVAEHRATGAWWRRRLLGEYYPPVTLRPGSPDGDAAYRRSAWDTPTTST